MKVETFDICKSSGGLPLEWVVSRFDAHGEHAECEMVPFNVVLSMEGTYLLVGLPISKVWLTTNFCSEIQACPQNF